MRTMSTGRDGFIFEFYKNFEHLKSVPIVLYGIGQYTRQIVENVKDFQIIGLMDAKALGQTIYGLKVLTEHEVAAKAKAIIIVSNLSIAGTIYKRIAGFTQDYKIEVYFLNGLHPQIYDGTIADNPYWNKNEEDLKVQILENDVISFDIFDTLLMRKCRMPSDIFGIVAEEMGLKEKCIDFVQRREMAEKICYKRINRYFHMEQIYHVLCEEGVILAQDANAVMQKEIEVEKRFLLPRRRVCEILKYAKRQKKTVILTSDMYLEKEVIEDILQKNDICEYDRLLLSCEIKKDKYWGSMWDYIKGLFPDKKILHIGDNEISDGKTARERGIETYKIASARAMLEMSGISQFLGKGNLSGDCLLWGMFTAKAMNNPFSMSKSRGKLYISDMFDFGYLFFGPLILNYLLWLIKNANEQHIDTILFVARDGYLLEKLYQKIISCKQLESPRGVYFLSSRRAASVASIETEEDIWFIFDKLCSIASMKYEKIMDKAFGIKIEPDDPYLECNLYETDKKELFQHTVKMYSGKIFDNAEEERRNYLKYIEKLQLGKELGFVNFVCRGVTQRCISKMTRTRMKGFYFASEEDIKDIYPDTEDIFCLYGEYESTHTSRLNLVIKYLYGETVFSAPDGQLICFEKEGKPIYTKRSKGFAKIRKCHMGIEQYIDDMINMASNIYDLTFSNEMVDKILGIFDLENVILSKEVKDTFVFEDYYGE